MEHSPPTWKPLAIIMLAVLAWGAYHAVGAYSLNHDFRRPLMVLGCVGGFLLFWLLMLWGHRSKFAARRRAAAMQGAAKSNGGVSERDATSP